MTVKTNVSNALMLGAAVMGMEYHVVTPKELEPTKETLDKANEIAKETGAKIVVTNDIKEGVKGMDVSTLTFGYPWVNPTTCGKSGSSC